MLDLLPAGCVVDGEIVIATPQGLDFDALQLRLHPAQSRTAKLARETPALFVAFDLLAVGGDNIMAMPQRDRRANLDKLLKRSSLEQMWTPAKIEGGVLTSATGFTLYTFDRDAANSGKSVCNGPCAVNWPPLMATEGWQNDHLGQAAHDKYSVITRDDGKKQWAYKGKPLYFWVKDVKAGDKTGEGVNNVWHVAKQ